MMGEQALISLDFENMDSLKSQGIDWETLAIFGRVVFNVSPTNYVAATSFIQNHFGHVRLYCDVTALNSIQDVISLLDNGVAKVFVSRSQLHEIVEKGAFADPDRLIICMETTQLQQDGMSVNHGSQEIFMIAGQSIESGKIIGVDPNSLSSTKARGEALKGFSTLYVSLVKNTLDEYQHVVHSGFTPLVSAHRLTAEPAKNSSLTPVHQLITGILRSDRPDGLYPTVVTDEDGVCLGLVYSNEQSIETALRLRRGVYYSRSRAGLWIKGEESGDIQQLISIEWDCDADALRFMVRQEGDGKQMLLYAKICDR